MDQFVLQAMRKHGVNDPDLAREIAKELRMLSIPNARSHVYNLHQNPDLVIDLAKGVVRPKQFADMTYLEMATVELANWRTEYKEMLAKRIRDANAPKVNSFTGIKCRGCGKKNSTYTQKQIRSCDESMTAFYFCPDCGKRWIGS